MEMDGILTTRVEARNGVALVALTGELDMASSPDLEDRLELLRSDGVRAIVIDLRGLTFVDSTGLRAFIRAKSHARENGHRVLLIGASRQARRVFDIAGVSFLLDDAEATRFLGLFASHEPSRPAEDLAEEAARVN